MPSYAPAKPRPKPKPYDRSELRTQAAQLRRAQAAACADIIDRVCVRCEGVLDTTALARVAEELRSIPHNALPPAIQKHFTAAERELAIAFGLRIRIK